MFCVSFEDVCLLYYLDSDGGLFNCICFYFIVEFIIFYNFGNFCIFFFFVWLVGGIFGVFGLGCG